MEFQYNLSELFFKSKSKNDNKSEVHVEVINKMLLPKSFIGDQNDAWKCFTCISQIIDALGSASAQAQSLNKPITSGNKLRDSEHTIYLLIDYKGKGKIIGMIKIGYKKLYLYNNQNHNQYQPLCILDFYIHESMQRKGYGKKLYDIMLERENAKPEQVAIDKPSEKFLSFLHRHYNLHKIKTQNNNYVVFEDFFQGNDNNNMKLTSCKTLTTPSEKKDLGAHPIFFGRYQHRPLCTMGQIVQNYTTVIKKNDLSNDNDNINDTVKDDNLNEILTEQMNEITETMDQIELNEATSEKELDTSTNNITNNNDIDNIDKADSSQEQQSVVRDGHLTEQGYFDLKFYHSPLW